MSSIIAVLGDSYAWGLGLTGDWADAANWLDTTLGGVPALAAPGANNAVTIGAAGGGATHVITGTGNSASLTVSGATVLAGTFHTGTLSATASLTLNAGASLGVSGDASLTAALTLNGGAVTLGGKLTTNGSYSGNGATVSGGALTAGSLTTSGDFWVSGGAVTVLGDVHGLDYMYTSNFYLTGGSLTVDGTFYSNSSTYSSSLSLSGGAQARLGGLSYSTFVYSMGMGLDYTVLRGVGVSVDATSSLEIGTAGGAAAGAITLDSGVVVNEFGSMTAPSFVDKGELDVTAGQALTISGVSTWGYVNNVWQQIVTGGLTGGGQVKIGAGSSLTLNNLVSSTADVTIGFTGAQGSLTLAASDLDASHAFAPTITGFDSTDVIDWQGTLTGAAFANGVLTLSNGAATVATLKLQGDYTGQTFATAQLSNGNTQINVLGAGDTPTPPPGTTNPDAYVWGSLIAGSWDLASNWLDTTLGGVPALAAPGANNAVTIGAAGGGATHVITGTGNSASLTVSGATVLAGTFHTGTLSATASLTLNAGASLGVSGDASLTAALTLNGGAVTLGGKLTTNGSYSGNGATVSGGALTAGSLTTSGDFWVSGGAVTVLGDVHGLDYMYTSNFYLTGGSLTVDGTFYSNSSTYSSSLSLSGGAQARLGGLSYSTFVYSMGMGLDYTVLRGVGVSVDATSSLEIGTAGGAAAGAITLDSGVVVNEFGAITAPSFVDKGELDVTAGQALTISGVSTWGYVNNVWQQIASGGLTGGGWVKIGAGSSLTLNNLVSSTADVTIGFTGAQGSLTLAASDLDASHAFAPTITGFDSTDVIDWQGTLTGVGFANGVLTLSNGAATVATLKLQGDYTGQTFATAQLSNGNTQINVLGAGDTPTPPPGTTNPDAYVWGSLIAGSWDLASNWLDTTLGGVPALAAPGANNAVTIGAAGGGATHVITGTGNSASLTVSGATVLAGTFHTGTLSATASLTLNAGASLGVSGDASLTAALTLNGGAVTLGGKLTTNGSYSGNGATVSGGALTAGSLTTSGDFWVSGGAVTVLGDVHGLDYMYTSNFYLTGGSLTVDGTFYSNSSTYSSSLSLSGGAQARLGGLSYSTFVYSMGMGLDYTVLRGVGVSVDATSSLEIGTAGGAAAGAITLDSGVVVNEFGSMTAPSFVDKGELDVTAGQALTISGVSTWGYVNNVWQQIVTGGLTGGGQVKIGAGSSLTLNNLVSSTADVTIGFTGAQGSLTLAASDLDASHAFAPTITGFDSTDVIDWQGTLTGAAFANGVLTLSNGAATVATLKLAGYFGGKTFTTNVNSLGQAMVTLAPGAGTSVVQVSASYFLTYAAQFGADANVVTISLTDPGAPVLTLSAALALSDAAGLAKISGPHTVLVSDTRANVVKLTASEIGALGAAGVSEIEVTNADVALNVAQRAALGANGIVLKQPFSGGSYMTVAYTSAGGVHEVDYFGITGQVYTRIDLDFAADGNLASKSWYGADGAVYQSKTWNADGTNTVRSMENGSAYGASYSYFDRTYNAAGQLVNKTWSNGASQTWRYATSGAVAELVVTGIANATYTQTDTLYGADGRPSSEIWSNALGVYRSQTWTYNPDGSYRTTSTMPAGSAYATIADIYSAANVRAVRALETGAGAGVVQLLTNGVEIAKGGALSARVGADTFALTSHRIDSLSAANVNSATFDLTSGFGRTSIAGLLSGTGDVLNLQLSMFDASWFAGATTMDQQVQALLAHTTGADNTVIADKAGDVLTLVGVARSTLASHLEAIRFT